MRPAAIRSIYLAALVAVATPAMSHNCRVPDRCLRGEYHGDCDESTGLAHGKGEARGAATYVGDFVKGVIDGKGVYTWEDGARLEGSFKEGKAHGPGVYVSAGGARYEGSLSNGKLQGLKPADCSTAPGPLSC